MKSTAILFLLLLSAFGCQKGPQLGSVTGTVTWEGVPLEGATVTMTPLDGQSAFDRTDQNGQYELRFADGRAGAPVGENRVTVETYRVALDEDGNPVEHPEILPRRFHMESEMRYEVQPGSQVYDLPLTKD